MCQPGVSKKKREEIQNFLRQKEAKIEAGHLVVFFVDECHLLGDDVCGYVWGKTDIRIEIPIKNVKDRQTYFGALDYQKKEFLVHSYPQGDSGSTIDFIKYLRSQYPGTRIALIWDGASYHKSDEVKAFLATINQHCEPEQWSITCILFAPNAPQRSSGRRCLVTSKKLCQKVLATVQIFFSH